MTDKERKYTELLHIITCDCILIGIIFIQVKNILFISIAASTVETDCPSVASLGLLTMKIFLAGGMIVDSMKGRTPAQRGQHVDATDRTIRAGVRVDNPRCRTSIPLVKPTTIGYLRWFLVKP